MLDKLRTRHHLDNRNRPDRSTRFGGEPYVGGNINNGGDGARPICKIL